jgi:hypothetical protein
MMQLMPWQLPSAAPTTNNMINSIILPFSDQGFSPFISYLIYNGIPPNALMLLLMLPIVATIIAFARQVVGIKGFGIYTPLIIAFAFWVIGLLYGILVFAITILVGSLMRFLVKKSRLLYLPRMAMVIVSVTVAILILLAISVYFDQLENIGNAVSLFAILVMITLVEKFIAAQIERGAREAIFLTVETFILAVFCYLVISWQLLASIVLTYPIWVIVISLIINTLIGRWTGLRLSEYYRFREVIRHVELPKKK